MEMDSQKAAKEAKEAVRIGTGVPDDRILRGPERAREVARP